jgi:CheY-like chemotaxis protein
MKTKEQPSLNRNDVGFTARRIRTLLVEDSSAMMVLLALTLAKDRRTFIVGAVGDGQKALAYASSLQPELVVTDLHMPGVDGAEVTRRLKERPNPPIVFVVTSDNTPEARARSLAAGADAFLLKAPDLAPRLLSAIQVFFPRWS